MRAILVAVVLVGVIIAVFLLDCAEQTVRFAIGARNEVQVGGNTRSAGSAEGQAPQAINRHWTLNWFSKLPTYSMFPQPIKPA